jgi:hypothetical protein
LISHPFFFSRGGGRVGVRVDHRVGGVYHDLLPKAQPRDYWAEVKKEVYTLICTNNRKYAGLKSSFKKKSKPSTTTIVSMISVAVTTQLGAVLGIITPLVALLLYAVLKVGVNSWCNLHKQKITTKKSKKK